ncbi:unnamed protein product [Rotaria socialis]|uniref:HAT C-terminal dimerisation domain-containing protein n=1 Tax=Rotaria socialis TaxID=392032 RepID=A0A821G7T9_9BILA|nr:unnamed protein product [Rotaria socialis]
MGLSLSIVDHTSFNDFMNDVDSKYKPIHRRDLTHSFLPALHKKCTSKLQEICAEAKHVSLTLDIWCDRHDSSETESESKSNDKKTDDYAPAVGEEKQLQTHEADDSIYQTTLGSVTEEEFLRLPCFCHCLQLVVNDGIKASAAAVSSLQKVASLAKLSHSSTVFSERLEEFNYTIRRANRTRWNSQFQTNDLILNSKDRKVLAEFVFLFELFNEATVLTQGESYATICLVAPTVLGILFDLERELGSSTLTLVSLCEALIASIKARFSGLLRYFEIDKVGADVLNTTEHNIDVMTKNTDSLTKQKCLFPYLKENKKVSNEDKSRFLIELDAYLCEESREQNLLFIKKHLYPRLYQLSLKYLSVPATSAPIERVFLQSGFLMRPHRASLTANDDCLLTFLKCNKFLL